MVGTIMYIRWFLSIFLSAITLLIVAQIFDSFHIDGLGTALLVSVILSILNFIVRPILVFFTLPITFLTLGLFMFVINAITLMIAQGIMDSSFEIDGFGTAVVASIVISIINALLNRIVKPKK